MGSSKGGNSTSSVTVPPAVLANYAAANANAQKVAQTPFQTYGGQFVAPVTDTQQAGINATNQNSQAAQPYFSAATNTLNSAQAATQPYYSGATQSAVGAGQTGAAYNQAATGLAAAGAQAVNATPLDSSSINQYLSPYLSDVANTTEALNNQQFQQAQSGQLGNAITSGAFGGDRAGVAAANLQQQQSLANNSEIAGLMNTGYNTALSTAQQQQGLGLSAGQANRAAVQNAEQQVQSLGQQAYTQGMGTSQQLAALGQDVYGTGAATSSALANLGTGAQGAALQGAQAQLAAGQVQQSTAQAQDTAEYNQFLQQQSYPFQTAQFLANIAEGTGSLSGSTTSTNTTSNGIFSDERLKEDIKPVGKTYDGQTIYSYRYKGDTHTQIGLLAQEVEKKHPDSVGLAAGFKTVDYGKATDKASERGHFAAGGLAGFDPAMSAQMAADYQSMYGPLLSAKGGINGGSIVPQAAASTAQLHPAQANVPQQPSAMQTANGVAQAGNSIGQFGNKAGLWNYGNKDTSAGIPEAADTSDAAGWGEDADSSAYVDPATLKAGGRVGLAAGGDVLPYANGTGEDIPDDQNQNKLVTAPAAPVPADNTMNDIADAAKIDAMFSNRGGRAKRAAGGATDDPIAAAIDAATHVYGKYGNLHGQIMAQETAPLDTTPVAPLVDDSAPAADDTTQQPAKPADAPVTASSSAPPTSDAPAAPAAPSAPTVTGPPSKIASLIQKAEGTAKNPKSSAVGPFQILNDTFKANVGAVNPALAKTIAGMSNAQLSAYRAAHPELADTYQAIGQKITADNYHMLDKAGITPTAGNVYLAHFLGSAGAKSLLTADPSTPVSKLVSSAAIKANPTVLAGKTAADVANWSSNKMAKMALSRKSGGRAGYALDGGVQNLLPAAYADDGSDSAPVDDDAKKAALQAANSASDLPSGMTYADLAPAKDDAALAAAQKALAPQLAGDTQTGLDGKISTPMLAAGETPATGVTPPDSTANAAPMIAQGASDWGNDADYVDPGTGHAPNKDNFIRGIGRGEATSIIPLLSGLGALATTQTKNPFTAIAAGLGAGAQAAQGQRQFGLDQQHVSNEAVTAQANAGFANANIYAQNVKTFGLEQANQMQAIENQVAIRARMAARDANGQPILPPNALQHVPGAPPPLSVAQVTPNMPNYMAPPSGQAGVSPSSLNASGAVAPVSGVPATPAVGLAGAIPSAQPDQTGSMAAQNPELAATQPEDPADNAPTAIAAPVGDPTQLGAAMRSAAYTGTPGYAIGAANLAKGQALLNNPGSPYNPTLRQANMDQGKELIAAGRQQMADADAQVHSQVDSKIGMLQANVDKGSNFNQTVYPQIDTSSRQLNATLAANPLNTKSSAMGDMVGAMRSYGVKVPDSWANLQGAAGVVALAKNMSSVMGTKLADLGSRAAGTELRLVNDLGAHDSGPSAGYYMSIIAPAIADLERKHNMDKANAAPKITNEGSWDAKWASNPANDPKQFVQQRVQSSQFAQGMTAQEKASYLPPIKDHASLQAAYARQDNYINVNGVPKQVNYDSHGRVVSVSNLGGQ